jgi:WD40 repeat protein
LDAARVWDLRLRVNEPIHVAPQAFGGVAFSPDGELIAWATKQGAIEIWDPRSNAPRQTLPSPPSPVSTLAFDPRRAWLAAGLRDGSVAIWALGVANPQPQQWKAHAAAVSCVAFNPAGSILASTSLDKTTTLWEFPTGTLLERIRMGSVENTVAFSHDGRLLLVAGSQVHLWDVRSTINHPRINKNKNMAVRHLAFSPDGRRLTCAGDDLTITQWNTESGELEEPSIAKAHRGSVNSIAFHPKGARVASAGSEGNIGTIRIWNIETGKSVRNSQNRQHGRLQPRRRKPGLGRQRREYQNLGRQQA